GGVPPRDCGPDLLRCQVIEDAEPASQHRFAACVLRERVCSPDPGREVAVFRAEYWSPLRGQGQSRKIAKVNSGRRDQIWSIRYRRSKVQVPTHTIGQAQAR